MLFQNLRIKHALCCCLLLIITHISSSQNYSRFLNYNINNQLVSNTVYDIMLSKEGVMWIATDNSIQLFNGIEFESFGFEEGVQDDENFFFTQDGSGRIWIGNLNGKINYYEGRRFKTLDPGEEFANHLYPYFQRISVFGSTILLQFNFAAKFYLINKKGVFLYPKNRDLVNTASAIKIQKIDFIHDNRFRLFYDTLIVDIDSLGNALDTSNTVYTRYLFRNHHDYVCYIDPATKTNDLHINDEIIANAPLKLNTISKVYTDSNYIFIGTSNGLFLVNKQTGKRFWLFEKYFISGIAIDPEMNYWISTLSNGIFKLPNNFESWNFWEVDYGDILLFHRYKNKILVLTKDEVIVSDLANKTLYRKGVKTIFGVHDPRFTFCIQTNELALLMNQELVRLNLDDLRITKSKNPQDHSGSKELIHFNDHYLANRTLYIYQVSFPSPGVMDEKLVFSNERRIFDMVNYKDSMLFVCTNDSTFYLDREYRMHRIKKLDNYAIRKLCVQDGNLLAITQNNTAILTSIYPGMERVYHIPKAKNEIFKSVQSDSASSVLLYTNQDIKKIKIRQQQDSLVFTVERLKDIYTASKPDLMCQADGRYYIHNKNGFLVVDTGEVFSSYTTASLQFDNFEVDDSLYVTDHLNLEYRPVVNITLNFSRVNFSSQVVNYEYVIVSRENSKINWSALPGNSIKMLNFSFGDYTIRVRETGSGKIIRSFSMHIDKPYWLKDWFFLLAAIAGLLLITGVLFTVGSFRRKKQEREFQLLKSEFKALNALMNPHFIFNSLNSLQNIVYKSDFKSAIEYIQVFSSLIRQNFINLRNEVIALDDEVNLVKKYLLIEKLRFKDRLQYTIHIDEEIDLESIMVPPLLMQPIVENSVKYGLNNYPTHICKIELNIERDKDYVDITITDNSGGISDAEVPKKYSSALQNIRDRIEYLNKLYRSDIRFQHRNISNQTGQRVGLEVKILIRFSQDVPAVE